MCSYLVEACKVQHVSRTGCSRGLAQGEKCFDLFHGSGASDPPSWSLRCGSIKGQPGHCILEQVVQSSMGLQTLAQRLCVVWKQDTNNDSLRLLLVGLRFTTEA